MKILSANGKSEIALYIDDTEVDLYPSLHLIVEISDGTFRGAVSTWLASNDFSRFLVQLRQCEQTRQGEAVLISMSPDEFKLKIYNVDKSGHFLAAYQLTRPNYTYTDYIPQTLSGGFELSSEFFIKLLSDFEELTNITHFQEKMYYQK